MQTLAAIEYSFFGCIFDNPPDRIVEACEEGTIKEWFTDPTCRLMWVAIESLKKKKAIKSIKALLIIQEANAITLKKRSEFYGQQITADFIDETKRFRASAAEGEETTIAAYASQLRNSWRGRSLEKAMEDAKKVLSSSTDTSTPGHELVKQINSILSSEKSADQIDVGTLLDGMTQTYEKAYDEFAIKHNYNYIPGIPYPWDPVSHLTKGLNPGLHIVAARPSVGKTSYITQCIIFWCSLGYKVAFNCLDMAVSEWIKRPVSSIAAVSIKRMEFGWQTPQEGLKVRTATETIRKMAADGLLMLQYQTDVDRLKDWCVTQRAAGKLDVVVIDFAQKFRLRTGNASEYEIVTYAAGVLKEIANELLIPVVVLSQLSRDNVKDPNGKRPPELSDLRGSGALEQDATSVILLHKETERIREWAANPPEYFVPDFHDPRIEQDIRYSLAAVKWNLAKNQNGETGEVPFVVYQAWSRWYLGWTDAEEKKDQYTKILADWRFNEEPFLTAVRNDAVIYPEYWPQKCSILCGQLGLPLPPDLAQDLKQYDLDRYENLLAERKRRTGEEPSIGVDDIAIGDTPIMPSASKTDERNVMPQSSPMERLTTRVAEETAVSPTEEPEFDDDPF